VAALHADLVEAGGAVHGQAGGVVGEDAARELVQAGALGLLAQRLEQPPADAAALRRAGDVDGVLADALVDAAVRVRAHAAEADDLVAGDGDHERQPFRQPLLDLRGLARARLERREPARDPLVVDRHDGGGVVRGGGPDVKVAHRLDDSHDIVGRIIEA
jgi:hypothetical protein